MGKCVARVLLLIAAGLAMGTGAEGKLLPGTSNSLPRMVSKRGETFVLGKKPYPPGTRTQWIAEGRVLAKAPAGYLRHRKALAGAVDNRGYLPPIRSQGAEGSCVHWAGAYYTKTANMKRRNPALNMGATSNQCSPRFTYNLTNGGEDNGAWGHEPFEIAMRYGCASLLQKPYVAGQYTALPVVEDFVEGLHRRTTNYVWVWEWGPTAEQINELKAFLDDGGVAACAVYAENTFDAWGPGDAPWYGTECSSADINHMVTVCGYGPGYYLVANSWGTWFGSNGYIVVDSDYFENYFSDVMYPLEGTCEPAANYARVQIQHGRRSDIRSLSFSVNGATVWSNSPLPTTAPLGWGYFATDTRSNWALAVDLSAAPWGAANVVTARCMDKVLGTAGALTNFTVRFNGASHVSDQTPVAIPDNTGAAAARVVFAAAAPRPWPDTSQRIVPFADQLPGFLTATQRWFAATRFAGTQKMLRSEIRELRAYNPDFLCLHYQLAVGAGPAAFVIGDSWSTDWPQVDSQTNWFLLNGSGERVHQTQWDWNVMDVRHAGGEAVSGFPAYWISNCLARIRAAEDDGVFADSFTPDGYGFGQCDPTHPWLEDVDQCLANWVPSLEQFGAEARDALSGTNGFVFLPNLGGLITSWLDMDYGVGHGGMVECFAFWGAGSYFDPADWELQMERVLELVRSNKIVICQSYPAEGNAQERMFATASHLLIKGARTYLNLLSTSDVALEYYPEYMIDLGGAIGALPGGIDALWDAGWGVYRRDYSNGVVVVNPSGAPVDIPSLGATRWRVLPSGGGVVDESGSHGGTLSAVAATSLALPAYSGAVLYNFDPLGSLAISPAATNVAAAASGGQVAVMAETAWTARTNAPWLRITSGASGVGNGTVSYAVAANAGTAARTGAITVAGGGIVLTCSVVQAGWSAQQAYPSGMPWAVPGLIEIENYDIGGQGVAYNDTTAANQGGAYRLSEGVDIAAMAGMGNGHVLGWSPAGEWMEYTVNVASSGTYALEVRYAALGAGGQIRVLVDGADQTGALALPNTGSWANYQTLSKAGVELVPGVHTVRVSLATAGSSGSVGAFDWFRFTAAPPAPAQQAYPSGVPWAVPGLIEIENYDIGGQGVAYNDTTASNLCKDYRPAEGVDIDAWTGTGNGHVAGCILPGEWMEYTINVVSSGTYAVEARVSGVGAGGQFRILVDEADQTGAMAVPNTGAWTSFQLAQKAGVELASGIHTVRVSMVSTGPSGYVGIFDWIRFTAAAPAPEQQAYPSGTPWAVPGLIEIENYDIGGQGVAYNDTTAANQGGAYRLSEGVDLAAMAGMGNGHVLGWSPAGEWMEYTVNVAASGTYALEVRYAALGAGGQIRVLVDGTDRTGAMALPNTGSWANYQTLVKAGVELASGVHTVRVSLATAGSSGAVGAFDWFRFSAAAKRAVRAGDPAAKFSFSDDGEAPGPAAWVRQGQAGWIPAPELVDGDSNTVWTGIARVYPCSIAMDFGESLALRSLEIDFEGLPWPEMAGMGTEDLREWFDLESMPPGPVRCRALYFDLRDGGSGATPAIREIRWEEDY